MLCFYVSFRGLITEEDFVIRWKRKTKMEERWIVFVGWMNKIEDFGGREEELSSRYLLPAFRWGRGMPLSRFFGVCTGTCWSGILFPARAIACSCRPCVISLAVRFLQRNRECFFFFLFLFHSSNGKCAANGIGSRIVVLPLEREYSFVLSNCTS